MSSSETLYWHDYETFGVDPAYDRPVQFAGLRTDLELKPVGEPLVLFAKPPRDYLPQPGACLVTGITPQRAEKEGVCEAAFIAQILAELERPGTCGVGYNSLRFDDTVTRFTLYRNLRDPYAREYGDGRSRWDLIDAMRTAYALRPEGIEWPRHDNGLPSFRLEDLTAANGIHYGAAHDALVDVKATIAMAQLLRDKQPKLYQWLFDMRSKHAVQALVDVQSWQPMLHVSGMFGAAQANLGLVLPLALHASNRNEVLCIDLAIDAALVTESPVEDLHRALYTPRADMAEGEQRPGIKSVHLNRCPVLLPAKMASEQVAERAQLDLPACRRNLALLKAYEQRFPGALRDKLRQLDTLSKPREEKNPDLMLYSGGFIPRGDRQTLDRLLALDPEELASATAVFEDRRLEEMLFRYRARNFPHTLGQEEQERWDQYRFACLSEGDGRGLDLESFHAALEEALAGKDLVASDRDILTALQSWGDTLLV
ncbi:MAG: exodeoxyribonuclease I [Congregibacter sp.]